MSLLENITLQMNLDDKNFEREFKDATKVVNKQMDALTLGASAFEAKWEDITSNLRSVKRVASGLAISAAIYTVTDAVVGASEAILTFRNNLEASKISMEYFAQSSNQAKEYIRELEDFAAYTPFNTDSAVGMAQYLQAMSVSINSSKSVLKVISDTAAATGATEDNMQRIVTALGQILTKGKLAAEEVRQLANANIPIYDILKERLDLTGQEIKNLGKLNINASKAVVAILDGLKDRYEGASEKIANTLGGMTETIKDDALIISEAFFHGTLDRLEDKIRGIRDRLDEWRDISLHQGTGGMIEAIIGDLDKNGTGDLEQFIIAAVAGFKNLGDTIEEFVTRNGNALKVFAKTAYASIMSLTIAADYLLRAFNAVQKAGERAVDIINRFTGTSLTLSDVIAGLLVFKTVGKTLYFAGNTALWAGKQFITLGTNLTAVLPIISSANAFTRGLVSGLITLGAAAATAYLGLKAIQGATGVTGDSTLVTDEYKQQMEEYNKSLEQWEDSLNQDYSTIADNWAASMSDALDDTEKKAKKTAKKIQKTWLMSFDEVFQIREDPDDNSLNDELEKFEDIDWGQFFKLPEFRFPLREVTENTEASYSLGEAIDTAQDQLGLLNLLLPGLISGTTVIGTILKNRQDYIRKTAGDGKVADELLSDRERAARLDEDIADLKKTDDLLGELSDRYVKQTKLTEEAETNIEEARDSIARIEQELHTAQLKSISNPTAENQKEVERLTGLLEENKKMRLTLEAEKPDNALRTQLAERIAILNKVQDQKLQRIWKQQALIGDMREIPTQGHARAASIGSAQEINTHIADVQKHLLELNDLNTTRNSYLRSLRTSTESDIGELLRKISGVDGNIAALSATVNRATREISNDIIKHVGATGGKVGIDAVSFENILRNNLRSIRQRVGTLTKVVSNTDLKELPNILSNFPSELSAIKKLFTTFTDTTTLHGIATDPVLMEAISKQIAALDRFSKPFSRLSEKLTELGQNSAVMHSDISRNPYVQRLTGDLEESIRTAYLPEATTAQDVVRLEDDTARKVIDKFDELSSLSKTLSNIPKKVLDQRVEAVYSIATEVRNLIADRSVYSTAQSLWYDKVYSIVDKLQADIAKLPNAAETKQLSEGLLQQLKNALGRTSAEDTFDTFTPLTTAIDEYAAKAITALHNTGIVAYNASHSTITELKTQTMLTIKQAQLLSKLSEDIEESKQTIDKLELHANSYVQERTILTSLDRVSQQLTDLAAASTGDVQELYTDIVKAIMTSSSAEETVKLINAIQARNAKALGVGNTSDTLARIWDESNLTKFLELHEQLVRMQAAAKPVPVATSGIPMKGIDTLLDDGIREVEEGIEAYTAMLNQRGLNAHDADMLIDMLSTLNETAQEAEETGKSIGALIEDRFDISGRGRGKEVPNSYMGRIQHAATADDLKRVISEIEGLSKEFDTISDSIDNLYTTGMEIIEKALKGRYDTPTLVYNKHNADYVREVFGGVIDDLRDELEGTTAEALKARGEETDAIKWLAQTYDKRGYVTGGFERATGALKSYDFYGATTDNIFAGLYNGEEKVLSSSIAAAQQNLRLGALSGSMTQQGTTAQGALAAMFGKALGDEIAPSIKSSLQIGMSEAFNTRSRSVLGSLLGNISLGGTGADATGRFGIKLAGLTDLEDGVYGLVQRIALSENSAKTLMGTMRDLAFSVDANTMEVAGGKIASVHFEDFAKAMSTVAPDLVNKVASDLIAGNKLQGIVFSVLNAAGDKFKVLTDNVNNFGVQRTAGMRPKEIQKWAEHSVADAMRRNDFDDSVFASQMSNIVITRDISLEEFKKAFEKNAQLLKDAATAQKLALEYAVELDLAPTTTYGIKGAAAARYVDTSTALKNITSSADNFSDAMAVLIKNAKSLAEEEVLKKTAENVTATLKSFDSYVRAAVKRGLTSGDIRSIQTTLRTLEKDLRKRILKSGDNLFVDLEQFRFALESTDPAAAFEAALESVWDAQRVLNESVPKQLATYNDASSKIIRTIDNILKDGEAASDTLKTTIRDLSESFEIVINAAQKLEASMGMLDHNVSARWISLRNTGDLTAINFTDPFKYLDLETSVGKMFADLEEQTGTSIGVLLRSIGNVNTDDLSRYLALRDTYVSTNTNATAANKVYPGSETPQIPFLGRTTNEDVLELVDAIQSGSHDVVRAADVIQSAMKEGNDLVDIAEKIAKDYDDGVRALSDALYEGAMYSSDVPPGIRIGRATDDTLSALDLDKVDEAIWDLFREAAEAEVPNSTFTAADLNAYMEKLLKEAAAKVEADAAAAAAASKAASKAAADAAAKATVDSSSDIDILARMFAMTNGKGLTNDAWFNAFADEFAAEEIGARLSNEMQDAYTVLLNSLYADMDDAAKDAFQRVDDLLGYKSVDDAGDAFRKAAQDVFGDDFDAFEDIVKAVNNPEYVRGPFLTRLYAGFARAMDNSFVKTMLQPNSVGISGIDMAAALAQSIHALSEGFDDYAEMTARWNIDAGYNIQGLDGNGRVDRDSNLVSIGDAGLVGLENLLIEGILTNVLQDAAAGAVGGLPGMAIGAIAALITNLGMLATGAYDVANVASESIKEMLNNHDFVAKQVKKQGGSDKEAREAQLNVARDLYTNYYNEMSGFWSMFDKASIRELTENKGMFGVTNSNTGAFATSAFKYAINELLGVDQEGVTKKNGRIIDANGNLEGYALDTDKLYEQLYTLYTTGGVNKIEDYSNMGFWGKLTKGNLTDFESDWLTYFKDIDDLSKARLDDMFSLQRHAADYIASRGEEATHTLLSQYGIITDDITKMIEGVVWLYETAINEMDRKMTAKAAAILSGDVPVVDLPALATGSGVVNRLLDGDLSGIEQQYLDTLSSATGVYLQAMSDTMYAMTFNIEDIRDKMTGFTVTFPESIQVGADTLTVKEIASNTDAVSILNGMGININADGTVTVSTEAVNANESGHSRTMDFDYSDISNFELSHLRDRGINLLDKGGADKVGLSLQESSLASAIKGLTYNLSGVDLTGVSKAAVDALKAQGISLTQDQETGKTVATISDAGYITGRRDIAALLNGLDPSILERLTPNLTAALKGIDAINAFGASHGESRIGSAAGIEVDTGFKQGDYSAALEQAFAEAGVSLKAAIDSEGNEVVYAAINNVGEQWHKAITQWKTSDVDKNPALRSFLDELGAEVYTSGDYTMVSTESILDELASGNKSKLTEILFDNAEMWEQFPEATKQAFIDAGLATEDGFIVLTGEVLDGWSRYQIDGATALGMAYDAMDAKTYEMFSKLQGTTIRQFDSLNNEQLYWLAQLGITSEAQYGKNADELLALITNKMGLIKNGNLIAWDALSSSQLAQLNELGITTEEDYASHAAALRALASDEMGLLHNDTIMAWDELSDTSLAKLHDMGINNEADYKAYLTSMNATTGTKMSELDAITQQKLAALGITTSTGWGNIKQVTDDTLSETEKLALGYMKFSDLPATIQNALAEGVEGSAYEALHDSWWAINTDADTQLSAFDATVDSMAYSVSRVKDLAQQLKAALADPALQAEGLQANLASFQATAIEAAKSSSNKWSDAGGRSYTVKNGALVKDSNKDKGANLWKDWDNDIQAANSLIAINEGRPDNAGNPMVYYIYNMYVEGEKAQVIRNTDGVLQKVMGAWYYNADNNIPEFKMGGMVTSDGLFRAGEFGLNEAIVPLEQPQAMRAIGSALAAAVPTWELVAPLANMLGQRDGGVAPFSSFRSEKAESSVEDIVSRIMNAQSHRAPQPGYNGGDADDRRPLYVGTLIADKAGLRELDRQMKRVVKQDGGR